MRTPAMSASTGSRSASSATDVDVGGERDAPKLSALFLIRFDQTVGYTIAWKRTVGDVTLDNAVEFKSLPSGLHTIESDLVYFVHDGHAGLSAFAKAEASAEARNAEFVSVGVLVSRAYGRLGRSWLLAPRLRSLAAALAKDPGAVALLEAYWDEQARVRTGTAKEGEGKGHSRARALSAIEAVAPGEHVLPPFHPALSMLRYVEVFGPLVFRLQQAALLRKRILFVGSPPVRTACEFVYNLSVLSSIPPRAAELVAPGTEHQLRLPALFSIGIQDIPQLQSLRNLVTNGASDETPSPGWVACTTDEIMATKKQLFDIIVEMPATYDAPPQERRWPTMRTSDGTHIRASQRDLRRYRLLSRDLWDQKRPSSSAEADSDDDDRITLLPRGETADNVFSESLDSSAVERMSWTNLAYNGFMWWASAGEQHAYTSKEREQDRDLLGDLGDYEKYLPTAVIAYFHRFTTLLVERVSELVEQADESEDEDEDEDDERVLMLDRDDISGMGLDSWSEADRAFVGEFAWTWFGREVDVLGGSVGCCGLTIPVP